MRGFGELEAAIMDRVWSAGHPVLVREIHGWLRPEREPAYNTVLTVVEILYRKGWLALSGSAVTSVILGGAALVVPSVRVSAGLSALLAACMMTLRAGYAHPGGAAMAGAGAVLGLAVTGR